MIETIRNELIKLVYDAWKANPDSTVYPIYFYDVDDNKPSDGLEVWCRVSVTHVTGSQATLSNQDNKRRWRRTGILMIQLFTPIGTGLSLSDKYSKIIVDALDGSSTDSCAWVRNVRVNELGREGTWCQTNIIADFEYDEVK